MSDFISFVAAILVGLFFFGGSVEQGYDNFWCDRNKVECLVTQPEIAFGAKEYHNYGLEILNGYIEGSEASS